MPTYTDITYHIVFGTKNREPVLAKARRDDLFRFVWGLLQRRDCHLYRIGGVEDHIHLLTSLHPAVALADLVKDIKITSSAWIKGERIFPHFSAWQEGYGAFTVAAEARPALIEYIKGQEEHHAHAPGAEDFVAELRRLVEAAQLEWKPQYLP
ncbi:MAG: IS200/IS605 family transposase [Verrucomicrobiales bacterium]|nr:IS200/IS605 family transposase [Verrucomicrobiales bacterium]